MVYTLKRQLAEPSSDPSYEGEVETAADSITGPSADVVAGYSDLMPPCSNLSQEEIDGLVERLLASPLIPSDGAAGGPRSPGPGHYGRHARGLLS